MFVEQEQHDREDSGESKFAEPKSWKQGHEKDEHDEMEGARDPKSSADARVARDGVESGTAVKFEILAGIEHIKSGNPEGDGGGEEKDARIEGATNGNPRGGRCDAEGKAENEMRKAGETLGIGIKQQNRKRDWRKPEGEAIELQSSENEERAGDDDKCSDEGGRKMAGRESPCTGAGIGGVDGRVGQAVEGHGGGTSGEHGHDDPEKLMSGGKAGSGEHGSAERERESEDGVLPLDHLQRDAQVVQDGHVVDCNAGCGYREFCDRD